MTAYSEKERFFEVVAKCGHVGRNFYVLKTFALSASSRKDAAEKARSLPRVKHHYKDAIRSVSEISYERFSEICRENDNDPYLHCTSIQEQRDLCSDMEIFPEENAYFKGRAVKKTSPVRTRNDKQRYIRTRFSCYDEYEI